MMTIHELAKVSGISVRTLHYYDKIDLLKPCTVGDNGYRKYDEGSLRRLQQILFYKEMDLPLKRIKEMMNQPQFDQKAAIKDQKDYLVAKRNRLTKIIEQMEEVLAGNEVVDFTIFEHNELEEVIRGRIMQLDEYYQQSLIEQYGSIDAYIKRMLKNKEQIKESAIKYYGSFEHYIEHLRQAPLPEKGMGELQRRLDGIVKQLAAHKNDAVSNPEVQALVEDWKIAFNTICEHQGQKEDFTATFQRIYQSYMNSKEIIRLLDELHGDGATVFIGKAMEYNDKKEETMQGL